MYRNDATLTEAELELDEFEFESESEDEFETYSMAESPFAVSPFSEAEEMELAAELLAVNSEEELDQFIGKLLKKAWKGVKKIARPFGKALRSVAKKALPFVGGALGSFIPIPGVGTAIGSAVGSAVGKALEAELEGLDSEDQEFEMARRFVRLAGAAAQQLADEAEMETADPQAIQSAILNAAQQQTPGAAMPRGAKRRGARRGAQGGARGTAKKHTGRWIRRGGAIILLGA